MSRSAAESDLAYVRNLVESSGAGRFPRSIYVLWAVLVLIGFGIIDFAPRAAGWFWLVAGPGGGLLSWLLGSRAGLRMGQLDREEGVRHALHWGGMLVLVLLAVALAVAGYVEGPVLGQVILLVVTMGWWTAGVHFDRRFLLLGGVMMAGFLATVLRLPYAWTCTAVLLSGALVATALRRGRDDAGRTA
jgi:hypothetical protein